MSKLLHSLPANAPTQRMHAAKLVLHRCPRHAQKQPLQSAAELFRTCYALRSFRQPTHLFLTAHGRSSSSTATNPRSCGSVRWARCYLSIRSCAIQPLPIRTAPSSGLACFAKKEKKKDNSSTWGLNRRPQTPSMLFINL